MEFLKLLALAAVIYLCYTLVYSVIKPMSTKRKKRARDFLAKSKDQQRTEKFLYFKDVIIKRLSKKLLLNEGTKEQYNYIIKRLDLKTTPEELRLKQIVLSVGALICSLIIMQIVDIFGYVSLVFIVFGWIYPIDELEKEIEKRNKNIAIDFPSFYSMVYYQYSRSINIYLADVVKDYLPNANPDMAIELSVLLDNIEYGEEYALKQFKKRVPLRHIIKFCDIMETRLRGYDNTSQMTYLKNELYEQRVIALEQELKRRQDKNARTQLVLLIILGLYIVIYYYFQFIGAIKLFN
ncbi:MAG: hypothetical protein N2645_15000 [Clostridia bacterium]|nr:hypothetical protein [Clostridia bacterium]